MAKAITTTTEDGITWLSDANGNRCSIEYFGSEEAAKAALKSLKRCKNCINCSDCSVCSRCSRCSDCSRCSGCSRCSRCSDCSDCSVCSGCSRCSRCSDCSDCSVCSRCSRCKNLAFAYAEENIQAIPPAAGEAPANLGPPPIPVIPNIHKAIYEVASQPGSLAMENVHTCENTHCRGGWAVTLAGEAGRALEQFYNWELAAMLIYDASDPGFKINPARFYDSNDAALEDMRQLAEGVVDAAPQP